jgi:hypothetical protein
MTNGLKSVSRDTYSFFNNHKKQSPSANCPLQRAGDAVAFLLVSARNMKASTLKEHSLSEATFLLN